MSRKRKAGGPSDPIQIALRRALERERERDPATWGVGREGLGLSANAEVETIEDGRGRTIRVRRHDVFDVLHSRGKLSRHALDSVRRLQSDIAVLHRTSQGVTDFTPRVDSSRRPESFSEARRRAGARIDAALGLAGVASARLLAALCEADVVLARSGDWRAVVLRETGESLPDAQGAILRAACENLAGAYSILARGLAAPGRALTMSEVTDLALPGRAGRT